ncbi:MAG: four helix bundle protein, partial [Candidatus Woesearchaeota archaeon]
MNKKIECFEDLNVWQSARELVRFIYSLTKKSGFSRDYLLIDQIRRSSISVMSNIT